MADHRPPLEPLPDPRPRPLWPLGLYLIAATAVWLVLAWYAVPAMLGW